MALVNTETAEIIADCTPEEARRLTDEIRGAAERVWSLLLEAHERQAWMALGYSTWADYVKAEFNMSRSRSYQMLDQGRVIKAIEEVTGVSTNVDISEAAARDLKPRLEEVKADLAASLADVATVDPEAVSAAVNDMVERQREQARKDAEDRAAMRDLNDKGKAAGFDLDQKSLAERGDWSTHCRELAKTADPSDFLDRHREHLTDRHITQAERAYAWLDSFLLEYREAQ